MRCVGIDTNGFIYDINPQPADTSSCFLVLASPDEFHRPLDDLLALSAEDGLQISLAILVVWGVALGIRWIARAFLSTEDIGDVN
jgi:hypothetical protein